jgi:hypothetical protein
VAIAETHAELASAALEQLLQLLERDVTSRVEREASDVLLAHLPKVENRLKALAVAGRRGAAQILSLANTQLTADDEIRAQEAAAALMAPLTSTADRYILGTDAVNQSILARSLNAERRAELIAEQLRRVRSPYEHAHNKSGYLHAAANLANDLNDADADALLPLALGEAAQSAASQADALTVMVSHPLEAVRMTSPQHDSRPAAALLAARLARKPEQRGQVRSAALALIGADGDADRDVTRALQVLHADLEREVPYLAGLG